MPHDQHQRRGGDPAHQVGGQPSEDDRGAADRRDQQLVEVAEVDLGDEREAGGRGGHREHERDRQLERHVTLSMEERRAARERLRYLADVDREEEERDEQRRDRGLGVARDLAHGTPAEQDHLGHAASPSSSSAPSSRRFARLGTHHPAGRSRR